MLLDQYTVLSDYKKNNKGELNAKKGDIVEVIDKNPNGWWFVSNSNDEQGWLPATYLESMGATEEDDDLPKRSPQVQKGERERER